ncbi:UDP-N-acetylmuramate:L-alanyl-gamma-D-glutamyl-meso-diaminopimelate ligase [Testudinibacter sp. TR-2022]|uniref:UDP-N-acetylmuramate:L-alanyl-gamma-D-glutamyl- meso-diaminopimelate ligase n=1 Tax=Testudinibacter sp. TR-2022 TaxID=2585029 RepID=UPI00159BE74E|nr:UDP-N-acetylmuramate:L-alanyl-gamma-D-glutamyl-meso-diaminopimelate ligase [Testudinibacter sp. TR-2022]
MIKQQHIHILGICGTFMGGVAIIARQMGYKVTGSDVNVYPPMSTFLQKSGIEIIANYDPAQLVPQPDMVIIGNAMKRGNPCVEYVLDHAIPYTSGPQWLHDNLLRSRKVLAVSGTHGKTTTSSILAWILADNGLNPGFLIGGVTGNFSTSAQLGDSPYFVIEADEYDTAFFDKRSKFVHYNPNTLIINNIGFDHADIFDDLMAIQRQFHHMIRIIPQSGLVLSVKDDSTVKQTLEMGCWSEQQHLGGEAEWFAQKIAQDSSHFAVYHRQQKIAEVRWDVFGEHNMHNALMAIAAAYRAGVSVEKACASLTGFINTNRRLELKGCAKDITVYDDFAHHPAEIAATVTALRDRIGGAKRILAVLEPRSNTMKMGLHKNELVASLVKSDYIFLLQPDNIPWEVAEIAEKSTVPTKWSGNIDLLIELIAGEAQAGDHILVMSNGSFDGIHQKLLARLSL